MRIWLQKSALIQPRTSPQKFEVEVIDLETGAKPGDEGRDGAGEGGLERPPRGARPRAGPHRAKLEPARTGFNVHT